MTCHRHPGTAHWAPGIYSQQAFPDSEETSSNTEASIISEYKFGVCLRHMTMT